ncbi:heavy-metal-associated domain-containing protein [Hymenobacter sp. NST-14]|uniref:heavy-metal-associated domain-containing protein n=1 Tax=Hymenobacter piscis TaxID=2839984 RepID=UPI001C0206B2|nr:heavy-metal-associated domain-containing protein [Hymenobacter piscis]MBT9393877.1 heavy-metal-associated domain-containing protein [Hymenobacter piscis]
MKFFASLLLSGGLLLTSAGAFAQTAAKTKGPATETLQLKTSAVCDMCKARLEKSLAYEKGVQQASLDVPSKVLTVTYRPDKTTPEALRSAVQKTGYDANDQTADARAYERLPECCKKTNSTH